MVLVLHLTTVEALPECRSLLTLLEALGLAINTGHVVEEERLLV